jgi:hypothetical protein
MAESNKSLAMKESEVYDLSSGPVSPQSMPDKTFYPHFHYEGPEELDIPEEGTMTIRYKQTREVSERKSGKPDWYECDVEVKEIVSVNGKKNSAPARSGSEAGEALDRLAEENYGENE